MWTFKDHPKVIKKKKKVLNSHQNFDLKWVVAAEVQVFFCLLIRLQEIITFELLYFPHISISFPTSTSGTVRKINILLRS